MIKIDNLTKIYNAKAKTSCTALDKVSITLPDTGLVFVLGKSGSGKSTLLNLMGPIVVLSNSPLPLMYACVVTIIL